MPAQIDRDFAGRNDAKAQIGAAASYLLRDTTGSYCLPVLREGTSWPSLSEGKGE